jgi:hypothetical protein
MWRIRRSDYWVFGLCPSSGITDGLSVMIVLFEPLRQSRDYECNSSSDVTGQPS